MVHTCYVVSVIFSTMLLAGIPLSYAEDITDPSINTFADPIPFSVTENDDLYYVEPTMSDDVGLDQENSGCTPAPGTPIADVLNSGVQTIVCIATDTSGNSVSHEFDVIFVESFSGLPYDPPATGNGFGTWFVEEAIDETAPTIEISLNNQILQHNDVIIIEATGSTTPLIFDFEAFDVEVSQLNSGCQPASGTMSISLNQSIEISCHANDGTHQSIMNFVVTVKDRTPPTISGLVDLEVFTTSSSENVDFQLPNASDIVDPNPVIECSPAPGDSFTTGLATLVKCVATDDSGNTNLGQFSVTLTLSEEPSPPTPSPPTQTMEIARPSSADRDSPYKIIEISGTLNNYERASVIEFEVIEPDGTRESFGISAPKTGEYKFDYHLDNTKLSGTYQIKAVYLGNVLGNISFEPLTFYDDPKITLIPDWIRNNAKWWTGNQINDSTFVTGIQYMINEQIIKISNLPKSSGNTEKIPDWVRTNTAWWADGITSDEEFIAAIKFLVETGAIQI